MRHTIFEEAIFRSQSNNRAWGREEGRSLTAERITTRNNTYPQRIANQTREKRYHNPIHRGQSLLSGALFFLHIDFTERPIDRLTDCLGPEYFLRRLAKKSSSWVNKKPGGLGVWYIDKSGPVQLFAGEAFDEETRVGLRKGFRKDEKQGRGERKRKGCRRRQRKKQDGSRRVLGEIYDSAYRTQFLTRNILALFTISRNKCFFFFPHFLFRKLSNFVTEKSESFPLHLCARGLVRSRIAEFPRSDRWLIEN